ncbi:MAG: hypothetical protein GY737_15265 [Desulfobacteraceae bacterium]|nr:hypothetical protein [Desulfobacteraceae bacterium]
MINVCVKSLKVSVFLAFLLTCILSWETSVRAAGPKVSSIGTFNGTTFWLGYNFSFSENYNPESETYNWMFYLAPEGVYVGLTSARSLYTGVDVNAAGTVFYGSWAIPDSKLSPAGGGNDLSTVTWDNMTSISGITITEDPLSATIPSIGPLINFGLGVSMGPTFFRIGDSKTLQKAIQLNSTLSVSLALVPMPPFLPGVALDMTGPKDTNLTKKDTGFYPVILWGSPVTLSDVNTHGVLGTITRKLQEEAAGTPAGTISGEMAQSLLDFFTRLNNAASVNGQLLANFLDKYAAEGASSGSTAVDAMISQAETWLGTSNQAQAARELNTLMESLPIDLAELKEDTEIVRPAVELGFQIAYKNGYDWAVENNTREDDILYSEKVITDYCATGTKTSVSVTSREIHETLGLTYSENSDIFEGETVVFNNSVETIFSSKDNMDTTVDAVISNHQAEHELVQNTPMEFLSYGVIYLDHSLDKFQGIQYKKVCLPRHKVIFLEPDAVAVQGETVRLSGSDPSGSGNTFQWIQVYGPTVALSGGNTLTPTFTAPEVLSPSKLLVFDLMIDGNRIERAAAINVVNRPLSELQTISRPIKDSITGISVDGQTLMIVNIGEKTFQFLNPSGELINTISQEKEISGHPFCGTMGQDWIWYTIYTQGAVYKIKKDGSNNIKAFDTNADKVSGIVFDNASLWVATQNGNNSQIHHYSLTGDTLSASLPSPVDDPSGLAFQDGNLWIADPTNDRVVEMDLTGKIVNTFAFPGDDPMGLAFDGQGFLWGVDFQNSKVKKLGQYPVAATDKSRTVQEGEVIILDGSGSFDPSGSGLSFQWLQTDGPTVLLTEADTATPSFIAPAAGPSGENLTFLLSVKNDHDLVSVEKSRVSVQDSGSLLTAEAGGNRIVTSGSSITLDGSSSVDAGDYQWKLLQGEDADIESPNNVQTRISFPIVDKEQTFRFELVVTDDNGNKASDMVECLVVPSDNNGDDDNDEAADGHLYLKNDVSYTLGSGSCTKVYGTTGANNIAVESGATVYSLISSGNNTITLASASGLFTVSRSGSTVTLRGSDDTKVVLPGTATPQTIIFSNGAADLIVEQEIVKLGEQEINSDPEAVSTTLGTAPGIEETPSGGLNTPDAYLILTGNKSYTLKPGSTTELYGSSGINNLNLESGAVARLLSCPNANTITMEAQSGLFNVSRTGASVTLEGNDGTKLILPATSTSQKIQFNDQTLDLKIDSGRIMLGTQLIESDPVQIQ